MRACVPGKHKKKAKRVTVDGKTVCVRYGDPNMTIKKHVPARKKAFCARHRCHTKKDVTTAGYWSCREWGC